MRRWEPGPFDFLGFTHICGRMRGSARFLVKRKSVTKRLRAKLADVRATLHQQRHRPLPLQGVWLRHVAQGWFNYHAVPGNMPSLETFHAEVRRSWRSALRRRSRRHRMPWEWFQIIADRWIPRPKILHTYTNLRFDAKHSREEPDAVMPHVRICAGGREQSRSLPQPWWGSAKCGSASG